MMTAEELAEVLGRLGARPPLEVQIKPLDAFSLIACLQLAWRHPGLTRMQKEMIEAFARQLSALFQQEPAVLEVIEMGWQRQHDVRASS